MVRTLVKGSGNRGSSKSAAPAATPIVIEAVLCFDTTGSMYGHLTQVRATLVELVAQLVAMCRKHKAQLRLGVIAHGDYCDKTTSYVIKFLPLCDADASGRIAKVVDFVNGVTPTGGGDAPECYELALSMAAHKMGWGKHSRRLMVMVGDDEPHPVGYSYGGYTNTIDWTAQLAMLAKKKVRIYSVEAGRGHRAAVAAFWSELAAGTKGKCLQIDDASTLSGIVCCGIAKELGDAAYAEQGRQLRARGRMTGEMMRVYEEIRTVVVTTRVVRAARRGRK